MKPRAELTRKERLVVHFAVLAAVTMLAAPCVYMLGSLSAPLAAAVVDVVYYGDAPPPLLEKVANQMWRIVF